MLELIGKWLNKKALASRLLWAGLGTVTAAGLLWGTVIFHYIDRLAEAIEIQDEASLVLRYALEAEKESKEFLLYDAHNTAYTSAGQSENLPQYDDKITAAKKGLENISLHHSQLLTPQRRVLIHDVGEAIARYDQAFHELAAAAKRKDEKEFARLHAELLQTETVVSPVIIQLIEAGDEATTSAKHRLFIAGIAILVFSILALRLLLAVLINRGVTQPLNAVVLQAKSIAEGNLRQDKLPVETSDEIGQLAAVFNAMLESLRDIASQTRSATETIGAASNQILASTQQQAASTKEQSAAVHETTSTVEEVRQAGHQISERARSVATAVENTSAASTVGLKAVEDTVETMRTIREQVEAVAQNIVMLSERTQAIGEIIQTVNDIAEQSHLLSLNAAIEAAAAGESGRRFSVVAGEIKNLADQAKGSTVQVRGILGDIQKGISSSVMLTEEAVKRVESGRKQSDLAEKTIREFTGATQESIQAFQQILGATHQQQIGYDQVTQALRDILKASEQTAAGTSQLEKGVMDLTSMSQQLRQAVQRYQL